MPDLSESPWWSAARHADRRPVLMARARVQSAIRAHLASDGFAEVDPACLQTSPGNEAHLHAFATTAIGNDAQPHPMYLHTSPEFAMKKLLAAGETRIFAFAHVWRNRERGVLHSPEFTMLEWYRVGQDYSHLMQDCASFLRAAAMASGVSTLQFRGRACDPFAEPERISVAQSMQRHAGINLLATLSADGQADRAALAHQAMASGIRVADDDTWSDIFSRVLSERVEPNLGLGRATLLDRYPVVEAALARPCADDPREAERFELYACGVELANGFGELTDPAEQRRRFLAEMDEKDRIYGERYPLDEEFLAALAQMPEASGCAMGFDRLVMLATGAPRIDEVMWTPVA